MVSGNDLPYMQLPDVQTVMIATYPKSDLNVIQVYPIFKPSKHV